MDQRFSTCGMRTTSGKRYVLQLVSHKNMFLYKKNKMEHD